MGTPKATDKVNWYLAARALESIGYAGPVTSEPFCDEIRKAIPALGAELPDPIDPERFYEMANEHLQHEGMLTISANAERKI